MAVFSGDTESTTQLFHGNGVQSVGPFTAPDYMSIRKTNQGCYALIPKFNVMLLYRFTSDGSVTPQGFHLTYTVCPFNEVGWDYYGSGIDVTITQGQATVDDCQAYCRGSCQHCDFYTHVAGFGGCWCKTSNAGRTTAHGFGNSITSGRVCPAGGEKNGFSHSPILASGESKHISLGYTGGVVTEVVATGTPKTRYNYGTITVQPGITYAVKVEILRNDLGSSSEKVRDITLDGKSIGDCNPDGGDQDWGAIQSTFRILD